MMCPICEGLPLQSLRNTKGAQFQKCTACGFIFRDPSERLTQEQEHARYLLHENSGSDPGYRRYLEAFIDQAVVPHVAHCAELLDMGSGPEPVLSRLLSERGYRVTSYDPYFHPDPGYLTMSFDAVILLEVIEHMADPVAELKRIGSILRPGGAVIVKTELTHDLGSGAGAGGFGSWWYQFDPTHISFFSRDALRELAARSGLSDLRFIGKNIIVIT